ncbi:hypothetical protein FGB62_124g02 [Gracilaria domingensis]|nr:hypothetical protein FGB62_124g02 [Gracilaria domingensis]
MDPGLAPRALSRLMALIGLLFVALITAGGFAFVGATEPVYEEVHVRNKVVNATRGNYIDFRNHVSIDGRLVSATLLMCLSECSEQNLKTSTFYNQINDDFRDLRDIKHRLDYARNSTCVTEANGFVEERRGEYVRDNHQAREACLDLIPYEETGRLNRANVFRQTPMNGTCPYQDIEVRCSDSDSGLYCVGNARRQDDLGGFVFFKFVRLRIRSARMQTMVDHQVFRLRLPERDDTDVLTSTAFLLSRFTGRMDAFVLRNCAASRVEKNASVQKVVGDRNVTQLRIALLMSTFGPAMALLVALATVALVMWVRVVWVKGRGGYNGFSSNEDALASAAQALRWHTDGEAERAGNGVVVRGVHESYVACKPE